MIPCCIAQVQCVRCCRSSPVPSRCSASASAGQTRPQISPQISPPPTALPMNNSSSNNPSASASTLRRRTSPQQRARRGAVEPTLAARRGLLPARAAAIWRGWDRSRWSCAPSQLSVISLPCPQMSSTAFPSSWRSRCAPHATPMPSKASSTAHPNGIWELPCIAFHQNCCQQVVTLPCEACLAQEHHS